jgi:SM-20-related protein
MLNPRLDLAALHARFVRDGGRVQIDDVLDPQAAQAVEQALRAPGLPWELAYTEPGGAVRVLDAARLQAMDDAALAALRTGIEQQASRDFAFAYWKISLVDAYRKRLPLPAPLRTLLETLASPAGIALARAVSGVDDIARVDAQATWYRPGNFLTMHDDVETGAASVRRLAYVLQLCRDWRADWGGLLHFLDARGEVEATLTPRLNCLALFAVPRMHCVSAVAPFARAPRLAVTGWFTRAPQA